MPTKKKAKKKTPTKQKKSNLAIATVIYGPSGVGKTSLLANLPDVAFITDRKEQGIYYLVDRGLTPEPSMIETVDSWGEALNTIKSCKGFQNLVVESITGLEEFCFKYHCEKYFNDDWSKDGFFAYYQGPRNAAKTDWPDLLDALDEVKARGINVWLSGHSHEKMYSNPEGADYDRFIVYCDKETWQITKRWATNVIYYHFQVETERKGIKNKARDEIIRNLYADWSPAWDAKNWLGMDSCTPAGDSGEEAARNLMEAMKL